MSRIGGWNRLGWQRELHPTGSKSKKRGRRKESWKRRESVSPAAIRSQSEAAATSRGTEARQKDKMPSAASHPNIQGQENRAAKATEEVEGHKKAWTPELYCTLPPTEGKGERADADWERDDKSVSVHVSGQDGTRALCAREESIGTSRSACRERARGRERTPLSFLFVLFYLIDYRTRRNHPISVLWTFQRHVWSKWQKEGQIDPDSSTVERGGTERRKQRKAHADRRNRKRRRGQRQVGLLENQQLGG